MHIWAIFCPKDEAFVLCVFYPQKLESVLDDGSDSDLFEQCVSLCFDCHMILSEAAKTIYVAKSFKPVIKASSMKRPMYLEAEFVTFKFFHLLLVDQWMVRNAKDRICRITVCF